MTVAQIKNDLSNKKVSAEELTVRALTAAHADDRGAFLTICDDEAMKSAKRADELISSGASLPLLGVPIAVKDNICTKGVRTTCASRFLEHYIPPYDAFVVERLKRAGAVIIGKTNMDEFAMGSTGEYSAYKKVSNALDKTLVAGGSSGGSSVAVKRGIVAGALGSDTGGSVRQPASFNGVVGLKPTYSALSRYGLIAFASSLDTVGVLANTVDDCATLYDVLRGYDERDSTSSDVAMGKPTDVRGKKIGLPKEYFSIGDEKVRDVVQKAAKALERAGATLVEVSLPNTKSALACYYVISSAEAASNLSRYDGIKFGERAKNCKNISEVFFKSRTEFFGEEVKRRILLGNYVLSSGYYDEYYLKATRVRTLIRRDFDEAFKACDVILSPTAPTVAFKQGSVQKPSDAYASDVFTVSANVAGLPALSLPCGETDGLPVGMQLIGKVMSEAELFSVARAYEGGEI